MIILLETPKNLLQENAEYLGANKICKQLLNLFLRNQTNTYIIVTDEFENNLKALKKNIKYKNCIFTNYTTLKQTLVIHNLIPDIAFVNDIKINTLLHWRNNYKHFFPIVGLVHGIHKFKEFDDLIESKEFMTPFDSFICPSPDTQEVLTKLGIPTEQTTIISYGVNSEIFKPKENKLALRKKYNLPEKKVIVLILSRISPEFKSDLTPLLRLLPKIENQSEILFSIVGQVSNISYINELKNFINYTNTNNLVHWNHNPDHNNIHEYFQLSDIFLSLSDFCGESFGLTVQEAMATGLPCILSEFSGYKVHINHNEEGFYIPTYTTDINLDAEFYYGTPSEFGSAYSQSVAMDNNKLIASINSLVKSDLLRNQMGKKAREKIIKTSTLEIMINNYFDYFKQCVNKSKKQKKLKKSPYPTVHQLLGHQASNDLHDYMTLELSASTKHRFDTNTNFLLFEKDLKRYKLIKLILNLLYMKKFMLKDLYLKINQPKSFILQNCLFLLKQGFIQLENKKL